MWTYDAPLRDMRFVIEDVLQAPAAWRGWPAHADLDADTAAQVLEEAAKFASGVLAPLNGPGDLEGCRWRDGEVHTPAGFADAYRAYVDGGWPALACDPDDGGQGLPALLDAALNEMLPAANHAWTMYPGLLHGAYACLKAHGSDELKQRYLGPIARGEWLPTMNLTEPQAGSDVGAVRTRAEPQADGSCRVTGSKIFISGGEHDLTDNIIHLVLARLPDAPPGTRGLTLLLAPKILPDGTRNAIRCDGIEKKMGIKGSATCVMQFEGATAWPVGAPHRGMAAMFVMMNSARLHVGLQGLGHLDTAQRNAHAYARERVQGRGQPIAAHPAVRRTLWRLRAQAEGGRVLAYQAAHWIDESHHHPDAAARERANARLGLLTPIVKALLTDLGHRGADDALQIWGGYGYVHEYGIEQVVRDSRIAMVYEGTNEIQAIDLLMRKIADDRGECLRGLLGGLRDDAAAAAREPALADLAAALARETERAEAAIGALLAHRDARPGDAEPLLAVADDVLHALGTLLLGGAWLRIARAALPRAGDPWYDERLRSARFGLEWLLPEAEPRWRRIAAGAPALPAIGEAG